MVQSDLNLLLDMGFEKARAELAIKKGGALNQALEWLETNQDKPLDELLAEEMRKQAEKGDEDESLINVEPGEVTDGAKSLVCNDCGKRFKNADFASYHATKTEHTDFSESTEEIKPLTEEEKKAKLEELRLKLKEKKANMALADKEEHKRNEQIRMKATKEAQDAKEELQRKEQMRQAAKKRQEKAEDLEAKRRIKAQIEADKLERQRKIEEVKAQREGRPIPAEPSPAAAAIPPKPKTTTQNEARLKLQTSQGVLTKTLPAETTLFEVAQMVEEEQGISVSSFSINFPRKTFSGSVDFSKTLREAGFVPSAAVNVK